MQAALGVPVNYTVASNAVYQVSLRCLNSARSNIFCFRRSMDLTMLRLALATMRVRVHWKISAICSIMASKVSLIHRMPLRKAYPVSVAMLYGDRDYACNYLGGEAVSLAINYTGKAGFKKAVRFPELPLATSLTQNIGLRAVHGRRKEDCGYDKTVRQPILHSYADCNLLRAFADFLSKACSKLVMKCQPTNLRQHWPTLNEPCFRRISQQAR